MSDNTILVGKRFTVVIPKGMRERLGIRVGDRLSVRVTEDRLVMQSLPGNPFQVLEEIVGDSYDEDREECKAEEVLRRIARG